MNDGNERLTAADYYSRLKEMACKCAHKEACIEQSTTNRQPQLYHELYGLLRQLCEHDCRNRVFSNLFSMLGYVCHAHGIDPKMTLAIQDLRRRAYRAEQADAPALRGDIRLLSDFVEQLCGEPVPTELRHIAPAHYKTSRRPRLLGVYREMRARVNCVGEDWLALQPDSEEAAEQVLHVSLSDKGNGSDFAYLREIVREGSTLSLIELRVKENHEGVARWIIYEPDFLMSPSELAAVFEPNAVMPHNYFLKSLQPKQSTYYTLLGIASGQMLDDLVFQSSKRNATYAETIKKVFRRYPLELSLLMSDEAMAARFHSEARAQFLNIKHIVEQQLEQQYGFDLSKALLEPSFVCPALGLAGRMDYLQSDGECLIEQKSGKRDEFRHTHKEPHYVQVMLYQLMITSCAGYAHARCTPYLLYSRYSDALMTERPYIGLLRQAIEMRNRIVAQYERMAEGKAQEFFEALKVDDFRLRSVSNKLWQDYIHPRLEELIAPFGSCTPRSKVFFYRFYTFLAKEQWLARMGAPESGAHGYADLWNNPALVRAEGGDMYGELTILKLEESQEQGGIDTVVFAIDERQADKPANFRLGDAVQIYAYRRGEHEPNVSRQFTLRGRLAAMRHNEVEVRLSNAQRNRHIFEDNNMVFALEHDRVEATSSLLNNGLYSLLRASEQVQRKFFLLAPAEADGNAQLHNDYGAFSELVAKSVAAKEVYIVIGPPGSGKTSRALRYMVEEHLHRLSGGQLLLMAYTNRAVDELCTMLEQIVAECPELLSDYLRLGNELNAAEPLKPRLLQSRLGSELGNVGQVRRLLGQVRIIVGSTTAMMQRMQLLKELHIETAFVDEASQILEPYILPFFTVGTIDKFILVGDQKQLPAVVMQSRKDSAISAPELNEIGIVNCADSVFDRMLHRLIALRRDDLYQQIQTQGRMHPLLYDFVNKHFYRGKLSSVPLVHQQRSIAELYPRQPEQPTMFAQLLSTHRVLFIDCPPVDDGVNDKVNSAEALAIAECLQALTALYEANGRRLQAQDVGIIVPYRNQIGMIRAQIARSGLQNLDGLSIDTVERYQGSQRDIILYSFTARHASQLSFLTSATYMEADEVGDTAYPVDRKLNVALTRAKEQMVIVGNASLLRRNRIFAALIDSMPQHHLREEQ